MPRRTVLFLLFLAVLAGLLGYNYFVQPFRPVVETVISDFTPTPSPTPEPDPVAALLSELSDSEKVGLVLAAPLTINDQLLAELQPATVSGELSQIGTESAVATSSAGAELTASTATDSSQSSFSQLAALQPGAVTLFGDRISTQSARRVVQRLKSTITQPTTLIAVDHEGGRVQRLSGEGFTFVPSWQQVCAFSGEKKAELYQATASEVAAVGVDLVFGPVVDYGTNSVLTNRICDTSSTTVVAEVQPLLDAYLAAGVVPVIKHFPGIGRTKLDLHTQFEAVEVTAEDASVYRQLLDAYSQIGVMISHVGVTNQFADVPCSLSLPCVGQVSGNYPEVLVVTDALEMVAAGRTGTDQTELSLSQRAEAAIEAGNHLLVFGPSVSLADLEVVKLDLTARYLSNQQFKDKLDAAVARVLAIQYTQE